MCAEKVFPVPCNSAPNPSRFPKTRVYHQEILTIHRADMGVQLIVFWSKALLRHPQARSSLEEMTAGTAFQRYIPDPHPDNLVPSNEVRRHILCTGMCSKIGRTAVNSFKKRPCSPGQVYHTLIQERQDKGINDVVISRVEQISPFPYDLVCPLINPHSFRSPLSKVTSHLDNYPNADVLWCQVRGS